MRTAAAAVALAAALAAQTYTVEPLVSPRMPRPQGGGFFFRCRFPALEGSTVVFRAVETRSNLPDSVWALDLRTRAFRLLAGLETPAPGGTGTFAGFEGAAPVLDAGQVVFSARDSARLAFHSGLYTVGARGGTVRKVADYNSADPESGDPFIGFGEDLVLSSLGLFFSADSRTGSGAYLWSPARGLVRLGAASVPFINSSGEKFESFVRAAGGDDAVAAAVVSRNLPDRFPILVTAEVTPQGVSAWRDAANEATPLPGNPNSKPRTRILVSTLQFDRKLFYFVAEDANSSYKAIVSLEPRSGRIERVASVTDSFPGLARVDPERSFNNFAVGQGRIAFRVGDTRGRSALFVAAPGGKITRVIGSGDRIGGQEIRFFDDINPGAYDSGRLAFWASLVPAPAGPLGPGAPDEVLALATERPRPVTIRSVTHGATRLPGSVTPGGLVRIAGGGLGPEEPVGAREEVPGRITFDLAGTRVLFDGKPGPLLQASDTEVSAFAPFGLEDKPEVALVVDQNGEQSSPFAVPMADRNPGLFCVEGGEGQAIALNPGGAVNGESNPARPGDSVVVFGTGAGRLHPSEEDGVIASEQPATEAGAEAWIDGLSVEVVYFGLAPGLVAGVFQASVRIPAEARTGNLDVALRIGSAFTQRDVTIAVER